MENIEATGFQNPPHVDVNEKQAEGLAEGDSTEAAVQGEGDPSAEQTEEKREYTEEEKLWSVVQTNPGDFQAWVNLVQESEKSSLEDIQKIRIVYDSFLTEFPLCYGYWKKYTDHEARFSEPGKIEEVFERAVIAVAYSVDMWMYYAVYKSKSSVDPEEVRSIFERGLAYVGSDYLAHVLWDKYLEFEAGREEWLRVAQLYTRILQGPLQQLDRYWTDFKGFAASKSIHDIFTPEEQAQFSAPSAALPAASGLEGEAKPAGGDLSAASSEGAAAEAALHSGEKTEAQQMEEYVAVREAYYNASRQLDAKIRDFEGLIKRPYFHVKPLDDIQLSAWHRYLDFVEKDNDLASIVKLYERCVIPTALYPEFWVRYVSKLEALNSLDRALEALERAAGVFVKKRPEIHFFAARYKENHADFEGARHSLSMACQVAPELVEPVVRLANFERRQGNLDAVKSLYESYMEAEKAKGGGSQILPYLYLQYARFIDQVWEDKGKAKDLYFEATEKCPDSRNVWEAALSYEVSQPGEDRVARVLSLVEKLLAVQAEEGKPYLSESDKEDISAMALEFVDLYGTAEAYRQTSSLVLSHIPAHRSGVVDSRKRPAEDPSNPAGKQSRGEGQWGAAYSASAYGSWGAAGGGQTWGGAYPTQQGVQAQTQAQAQAQAYAGYGQAYAYNAAAPTAAAYGGYAQTYPAAVATPAAAATPQAYGQAAYSATPAAGQAAYYPAQQQGYYAQ